MDHRLLSWPIRYVFTATALMPSRWQGECARPYQTKGSSSTRLSIARPAPVKDFPRSRCVGDTGILIEFGDHIAPEINDQVIALDRVVEDAQLSGVVDL